MAKLADAAGTPLTDFRVLVQQASRSLPCSLEGSTVRVAEDFGQRVRNGDPSSVAAFVHFAKVAGSQNVDVCGHRCLRLLAQIAPHRDSTVLSDAWDDLVVWLCRKIATATAPAFFCAQLISVLDLACRRCDPALGAGATSSQKLEEWVEKAMLAMAEGVGNR